MRKELVRGSSAALLFTKPFSGLKAPFINTSRLTSGNIATGFRNEGTCTRKTGSAKRKRTLFGTLFQAFSLSKVMSRGFGLEITLTNRAAVDLIKACLYMRLPSLRSSKTDTHANFVDLQLTAARRASLAESVGLTPKDVDDMMTQYDVARKTFDRLAQMKREGKPIPKTIEEVSAVLEFLYSASSTSFSIEALS